MLDRSVSSAAMAENQEVGSSSVNRHLRSQRFPVSSLLAALKECSRTRNLARGKRIHSQAAELGFLASNTYLSNSLINMYAKCGSMIDARRVFDNLLQPDVVAWTSLIIGYAENGHSDLALKLYDVLEESHQGASSGFLDSRIYVAALTACATLAKDDIPGNRKKWLQKGELLHSKAVMNRCSSVFLENALVDLLGKCGDLVEARRVFNSMPQRSVVSWTTLIQAYVENGEGKLALELFEGMEDAGCDPNSRTYVAALSACASLVSAEGDNRWLLEKAKEIFSGAVKKCCANSFVQNTVLDFYTKCGCMEEARKVFDRMDRRSVVSWTALIMGYVDNGESELALELFDAATEKSCGFAPDGRIYVGALTACSALAGKAKDDQKSEELRRRLIEKGKAVHSQAVKNRCCDTFVENTLIDLYAKCGSMAEARSVFEKMKGRRTVVSWNALLQGYVENREFKVALEVFDRMKDEGDEADGRTYVAALSACASLAGEDGEDEDFWYEKGKEIHHRAVKNKCCDLFVESTLVDMYGKCGRMDEAKEIFDGMSRKNVVSWTALIMGYADNGESELALNLLAAMDASGIQRNPRTYVAALTACGDLMALENGRLLHEDIVSCGLEKDVVVANCLVDFYGKCGSMEAAKEVFDSMARKTIVSWTALMCGYSLRGEAEIVFELFEKMKDQGIRPEEVVFVCVLSACSHAGLTEKGREYFDGMFREYGVRPTLKHYACMVDLLGRANCLEEALRLVGNMPLRPDFVIWTSILDACRKWNNAVIGRVAYEALLKLDDRDGVAYVLMGNLYK